MSDPQTTKWRHKKRGTIYEEIGRGMLQLTGPWDEFPVVIYRGEDGHIWVRTEAEFKDGRFERVE